MTPSSSGLNCRPLYQPRPQIPQHIPRHQRTGFGRTERGLICVSLGLALQPQI